MRRFEQMATNVNVRIDNPSDSGMEHYVGLEHLDPDSLRIPITLYKEQVETSMQNNSRFNLFGRHYCQPNLF